MSGCCPTANAGITSEESIGPAPPETAAIVSPIFFPHRVSPVAAVSPPLDAWGTQAPYFQSRELSSLRVVADFVDLIAPAQWCTATDQSCVEAQLVGRPMPEGVDFTGGTAWMISRNGTSTGTARPWASLRVFDTTGTILRATLIPLGEHGSATNMTPNGTRVWLNGVALASYVTQEGDRLVLEQGGRATGLATWNCIYGSISNVAGNTRALHVLSTSAEGVNPGSRAPYLELTNILWPRAA